MEFEAEAKQAATRELIELLGKLGGEVSAFSHSLQELRNVLRGAADFLESREGRGPIIIEARKNRTTRSDLLLLAESVDDRLRNAGIQVKPTPPYIDGFQIDEAVFEAVLEDEVSHRNPRAREFDINSVRSIYAIRGNLSATSLERCKAVFVTSNSGFATAAWDYGQRYEQSQDVSSVITDFSLANMAWLKAPMGAPALPMTQLLAFSYAALEPPTPLWSKYLDEIDKLETKGKISERDHQLLRSSPHVYPELMHLTLGQDAALTEETVTETLQRVSSEIRKEESQRLESEEKAHQKTRNDLTAQQGRNQQLASTLYWRCQRQARAVAWTSSVSMAALLAIALLFGLWLRSPAPPVSWILIGSSTAVALSTLANLIFGSTVKEMHVWLYNWSLTLLLKREATSLGIDLTEFGMNRPN